MFGTIMFAPLFFQSVLGASASESGLALTPLMLAMVASSVASGQVISRTGRYRWALLAGPVIMAAGFLALEALDPRLTLLAASGAMVVIGLGLGQLLQNLVLVIQTGLPSRMLGVATSSAQFFRAMCGTIGVTVLGTILTSRLPRGFSGGGAGALAGGGGPLPAAARAAFDHALNPLFLVGPPLMAVAFVACLAIPQVPLRRNVRDHAGEPAAAGSGESAPPVAPPRPAPAGAGGRPSRSSPLAFAGTISPRPSLRAEDRSVTPIPASSGPREHANLQSRGTIALSRDFDTSCVHDLRLDSGRAARPPLRMASGHTRRQPAEATAFKAEGPRMHPGVLGELLG